MIFCFQGTPSSNELIDSFQSLQIILAVSPFISQRTQRRPWGSLGTALALVSDLNYWESRIFRVVNIE